MPSASSPRCCSSGESPTSSEGAPSSSSRSAPCSPRPCCTAGSLDALFAARALQGIATGTALGAVGAALLDLQPSGDARNAALVNGVASVAGIGFGALVSSLLVQFGPDPLVTPYAVLFGLFTIALLGTLALPEPVTRSAHPRLRPQRPSVPLEA